MRSPAVLFAEVLSFTNRVEFTALDEFDSPETKHQHCRQADHAAENPKISYCSAKSHGNFSKIINKKTYKNYNLKSISKLDKYAIDN